MISAQQLDVVTRDNSLPNSYDLSLEFTAVPQQGRSELYISCRIRAWKELVQ